MFESDSSRQKALITQAQESEKSISAAASHSEALEAAISAAEHYMKALKLADSPKEKRNLDAKCKELLTRAEKIKESKDLHHAGDRSQKQLYHVCTRKLTAREEIILLEGAKLHGFIFPPWASPPDPAEFELGSEEEPFTDKPDLRLSAVQREIFAGWKRPHELLSGSERNNVTFPVTSISGETDLVQDALANCSVVASLCAIASRAERGSAKHQFLPVTYPREGELSRPKLSPSGKYVHSFYFNGCFRKVVIDNRLPSSKSMRSLYVTDRNDPNLLWPALVEKAYLKVRGGYDFPGSNSGTDLWVLTGWIPEQIFLHREDVTSDQIWKRLFTAFGYGDVLLTVGTGKLTETEQKGLGLVSEHDYAILDMKESEGQRLFLVKNPWAEGAGPGPHQKKSTGLSPGTFWMDCEKMFQCFENLYLNWNPRIFKYREDVHFTWNLAQEQGSTGSLFRNPQYSVSSRAGGIVWLLLGKHFITNKCRDSAGSSHDTENPGFISIYIFNVSGGRISLSDGALHRGPYVDSPNTLMRLRLPPKTTYTAVITEDSLPRLQQNFTLSAFSIAPVDLAPIIDKYNCLVKIGGTWTRSTAGGNAESPHYSINPQFSLNISQPADISILLECPNSELAMHVRLFWSKGKRIAKVRNRDVIQDSGDYRRGCALVKKAALDRGTYTIVCSTFAPDQLGSFTLYVSSTTPCEVKLLPLEEAGRRVVVSDTGVLPPGRNRILAPLRVPRLTRMKLVARSKQPAAGSGGLAPSLVLMTVELGRGPYKEILVSSENGTHSDMIGGIRIDDFDLVPGLEERGGIWIAVERIGGQVAQTEDRFEVEALGEEQVEIGEWILED